MASPAIGSPGPSLWSASVGQQARASDECEGYDRCHDRVPSREADPEQALLAAPRGRSRPGRRRAGSPSSEITLKTRTGSCSPFRWRSPWWAARRLPPSGRRDPLLAGEDLAGPRSPAQPGCQDQAAAPVAGLERHGSPASIPIRKTAGARDRIPSPRRHRSSPGATARIAWRGESKTAEGFIAP